MSDSKMALVKHDTITHPPVISDGGISPKVIWEFKNQCVVYLMDVKGGVMEDQRVTKLLGSFKNTLIDNWMSTECDRIVQLSFTDFMNEFQEQC